MSRIRHSDLPRYKESVMSEVFGRFIGFVKSKGLIKGKEYETRIEQVFEVSTKFLWIDEYSEDFQITVVVKSLDMSMEFGFVKKNPKEVIYREKLENLRYNVSSGSELALTGGSEGRVNKFFESFKEYFKKLEP